MTIVYIAHAISSDPTHNLARIRSIMKELIKRDNGIQPIAPYLPLFDILDNSNPEHYRLGLASNEVYFRKRFVDALWVFGHEISRGVLQEILWAKQYGVPAFFAYNYLFNGTTELEPIGSSNAR